MDSFFSIGKKPVKLSPAGNILPVASVRRAQCPAAEKRKGEPGSPSLSLNSLLDRKIRLFYTGLYMAPLSAELTMLA